MMNFNKTVLTYLKERNVTKLKEVLNEANELEIINIMDEMSNEEIALSYRLLDKDLALSVFEGLDIYDQQKLIKLFQEKDAIEVFKELAPDDRVSLVDELPATVAKRLLASLDKEERDAISLLMGFEPSTAGRLMTPKYVRLRKEFTAAEALEHVRQKAKDEDTETIYKLYITDATRKLEGRLELRDLLIADENAKIADIMDEDVISFQTSANQEEVAKALQKLDLLAVPIVDKEDRLVGIITIDDAIDILEEEATDDILSYAGIVGNEKKSSEYVRSATLIDGSHLRIWKLRVPILIVTLVAGMVSGGVIGGFEDTLGAVPAIAMFIPLIMDMGGNVGGQSSTIFIRGQILGHIELSNIWKHFFKETSVGVSMGLILGAMSAIVSYIWQGIPGLSIALFISMVVTLTIASSMGFLVPYILYKLKIDQAVGTGPLVTSVKDITGLLIYFISINMLLGHLLEAYAYYLPY